LLLKNGNPLWARVSVFSKVHPGVFMVVKSASKVVWWLFEGSFMVVKSSLVVVKSGERFIGPCYSLSLMRPLR
jgi:hypothetical protein